MRERVCEGTAYCGVFQCKGLVEVIQKVVLALISLLGQDYVL